MLLIFLPSLYSGVQRHSTLARARSSARRSCNLPATGAIDLLVATGLAGREIDIPDGGLVVNSSIFHISRLISVASVSVGTKEYFWDRSASCWLV